MDTSLPTMLRILASDIQSLHRSLKTGSTLHVLVEAGNCSSPDALASWAAQHGLPLNSLFAGTSEARYAAQGPWLVALPEACSSVIFEELANFAVLPRAMLLVSSPLPPLRLTVHLQSWLAAVHHDAQGDPTELLVRYFDACTGMDMVELWPEAERRAFVGAFDWWGGWDERFSLHVRQGSREPVASIRSAPLSVSEDLLERIDALNRTERLVALVVEQDAQPGELDGIAPWLHSVIAHQALSQAHALGLEGWSDERIVVALALRVNPEMFEQPYMPALIAQSRGAGGFGAVIADIPPGALQKERAIHAAAALQRTTESVVSAMTARSRRAA